MPKVSYSGYRFPPRLFTRRAGSISGSPSVFATPRTCSRSEESAIFVPKSPTLVNHFGPIIGAELRKRRPHLDEVYLKIDGRMVYVYGAPSTPRARFRMCWSSPRATSDGRSARCNASRARARRKNSSQPTPPLTTFQRPTPSHVSSNPPRPTRRRDDHLARGRRGGLKIRNA
jgi:hypothetical protein